MNIFREFIFILFYRKTVIITIFLAVFIISLILAVGLPSIYRSTAKFALTIPQTFDPLQQESMYDYRNRMRRVLQDQRELVLSDRVMTKVVQELYPGITRQPEITKRINELRANLDAAPPGGETFEGSSTFIIEFADRNPQRAANVATHVMNNYMEAWRELAKSRTNFSHSFFVDQVETLAKEMKEKEQNVRDFETKQALALLEILNLGDGKSNAEVGPNVLLTQFMRSYLELQTELAGLQTSIEALEREAGRTGIPTVLPEMEVTGRAITVFKTKVAQLQIQLNEMRPQFKENFEPMRQVEQELQLSVDSLKKELKRTVDAQKITAQNIKARIAQLEKTMQALQERIQAIAKEKATYDSLKHEFSIAKDNYTRAQQQQEQARMAHSLQQDRQFMTLIDRPKVPVTPFKPNRLLLVIGGFIAGLFLAIAVALTIDNFDHRMKTVYQIEKQLSVPVLGSIPNL